MGGEAVLLPDGQTVSCTLSYRGFPSVAAAGTVLTEGKWYYEAMVLTDGLMQIDGAILNSKEIPHTKGLVTILILLHMMVKEN